MSLKKKSNYPADLVRKIVSIGFLIKNIDAGSPGGIIIGYVIRTGLCIKNIVSDWNKSKNKCELISSNVANISLIVGPLWKWGQIG